MNKSQEDIEQFVAHLKQQRDELIVRIHLGKAEAKQEWEKAEQKWEQLKSRSKVIKKDMQESSKDIKEVVKLLGEEIKHSYQRIRQHL